MWLHVTMLPWAYGPCQRGSGLPRTGRTLWANWSHRRHVPSIVVLTSRATCVPQAAVTSGIQRSAKVTASGLMAWAQRL